MVLTQFVAGRGGDIIGCAILIVMGTWSKPVDRRSVAHFWKKGISMVDAKERSTTESLEVPLSGKRVFTAGMFR